MSRAFEAAIKKVDVAEVETLKDVVGEAYERIFLKWPAFTFFSMANHRISIMGSPIRRLEPATRPSEKGALLDKQEAVRQTELAKLANMTPTRRHKKVYIGNSVDYSKDVGFSKGNGAAIYQEAAQEAAAVVKMKRRRVE